MAGPYRILAIDVDGTLLDGRGILRPRTIEAVNRAARAGIRPILCTGRRYRRARPIADQLGLDAPIVCNSGAIVKEPADHRTLWRADIDPATVAEVLRVFADHDEPSISFLDNRPDEADFLVDRTPVGRPLFDDYLTRNGKYARVDPAWNAQAGPHYHLCAIGERTAMLDLERDVLLRLADRVRTFVQKSPAYTGTMCEVIRRDASKWAAVLHVADQWGVVPGEICAVGDDMNDLPMIEGAGLGVAMAHAPESVRAVADHITAGNDDDGLAILIENVLLAG